MGNSMAMAVAAMADRGDYDFHASHYEEEETLRLFVSSSGDRLNINGQHYTIPLTDIATTTTTTTSGAVLLADASLMANALSVGDPLRSCDNQNSTRGKKPTKGKKPKAAKSTKNNANTKNPLKPKPKTKSLVTIDWTIIKGVKMTGHIGVLLVKHPSILERLVEEIMALPSLERVIIALPFQVPSVRRFLRILQRAAPPPPTTTTSATTTHKNKTMTTLSLDDKGKSIKLAGDQLEVFLYASELYSGADTPNETTERRLSNLYDPLVQQWLQIPTLTKVTWPGCPLMADTYLQLTAKVSLVELNMTSVALDQFHVTTLVRALTPPPPIAATTSTTSRKRKRTPSTITTSTLVHLRNFKLHDVQLTKDGFLDLCRVMHLNNTIRDLVWHDVSVRPSFRHECQLWDPILDMLLVNTCIEKFTFKEIYNLCVHDNGEGHLMQLDDEYTHYMAGGLHHVLQTKNTTLTKVDWGFRPAHPDCILELLHLNAYGLRPFVATTTTTNVTSNACRGHCHHDHPDDDDDHDDDDDDHEDRDDDTPTIHTVHEKPFTKQEFQLALIHAVELSERCGTTSPSNNHNPNPCQHAHANANRHDDDHDDDTDVDDYGYLDSDDDDDDDDSDIVNRNNNNNNDTDSMPPLVPCLFKIFSENPTLVTFLS